MHTFAHAAQAVALVSGGVMAVVGDREAIMRVFLHEGEPALGGAGVADDVGDGFAQGEGEDRLFAGGEAGGLDVTFNQEIDPGGGEDSAGGLDFRAEPTGSGSR